jgi:glyoxylase-like metal-dependent hydrolase (beta-lactamase superfamily II)
VTDSAEDRTAWTRPGAQDLGNGVYRIPLPLPNDGLHAVNVYALRTADGLVLIDGGWALAESAELLATSLSDVGFGITDIKQFLVTHIHRDHYTQAIALREQIGAKVSLGIGEKPNLEQTQVWVKSGFKGEVFAGLLRSGAHELYAQLNAATSGGSPASSDWQLPDEWLHSDTEVLAGTRRLRVIATPGHTAGHVVFHDAQAALLFAGDHVLPHITPSIGFEPVRTAFPLRDYLDSLRLMRTMPDAKLLPAHGPVKDSVHERVTELLSHHADRLDAAAAVVQAGAAAAYDAAQTLTWTRHERKFADLGLFNQALAVAETGAHLDVLVLQGRLTSAVDSDGVEIYQVL